MRPQTIVGERIREARKALRMTQTELGRLLERYLGTPWKAQSVSAAERGDRDFAVVDLIALARVLGIDPSELVPGRDVAVTFPGPIGTVGPDGVAIPESVRIGVTIGSPTITQSEPADPQLRRAQRHAEARRLARELAELTTKLAEEDA
jgi:transcriptional regulator with XRE-family HTH domain